MYQIGEVARLAKVTVKQLHHYDAIGLLQPSSRSASGYRLYSRKDLEALQHILFYRVLEFSLEEIMALMSAHDFDRRQALQQQRALLSDRFRQLGGIVELIDSTLANTALPDEERHMNNEAMFAAFPDLKQKYQDEAEQRWGDTAPWQQSRARSATYNKADWNRMAKEMAEVQTTLEQVFSAGFAADSEDAMAAAEQARLLINRWHYDCSREFHINLTLMTSQDERFVKNLDKNCPGLASYLHEAAQANLEH